GRRAPRSRQRQGVARCLWAGDTVTFRSQYCRLVDARLELRPVQQPHPPIWVAANNDRAVERAAELGDAWVINPHATLHTIHRQMALYRAALERLGKPFPAELPMIPDIYVAETHEAAVRLARPYLEKKY